MIGFYFTQIEDWKYINEVSSAKVEKKGNRYAVIFVFKGGSEMDYTSFDNFAAAYEVANSITVLAKNFKV